MKYTVKSYICNATMGIWFKDNIEDAKNFADKIIKRGYYNEVKVFENDEEVFRIRVRARNTK